MRTPLAEARGFAASYLERRGRPAEAQLARSGGGDDFPEVQVALLAQQTLLQDIARYRRALDTYADDDFWEAEFAEAAPAFHDRGQVARGALIGRELYDLHRD